METTKEDISFETRDEYNRKPIAENIIKLLKSDAVISPFVIDGSWGSGKTEFTYKLINLLKENLGDYKLIYIDAFKIDHADEPLVSLLASILELLPDDETSLRKKAIPAIRFGIKTVLKAGVGWVLRQEATEMVDEFDTDIKKATDQAINASVDRLLKDHQKAFESIETLKQGLKEATSDTPIIIFIDELDRCRPDFAIRMLEKIKHIFEAPNLQFVLIANKDQLRSSIKHCYGESIDSQKYLDKFIRFSLSLPHSSMNDRSEYYHYPVKHYFDLIKKSTSLEHYPRKSINHSEFVHRLFQVNQTSLREVETLVQHLEIFDTLSDHLHRLQVGPLLLIILGIFIYCFKPEIRKEIEYNKFDAKKINALLGISSYENDGTTNSLSRVKAISSLVYLEANVNGLVREDIGLTESGLEILKNKIDVYFADDVYYGINGRLEILSDTINTLKLT